MFDFIWKNKEWLFSGVGIVLIVLLLRLIRFIYFKSHRTLHPILTDTGTNPHNEATLHQRTIHSQKRAPLYTSLTPQGISESIDNAPIIKQPEVAKRYKGQIVTWKGIVESAFKESGNNLTIYVSCNDIDIFFDVRPKEQQGLQRLKAGDRIVFTGKIEEADSGMINLRDVTIEEIIKRKH